MFKYRRPILFLIVTIALILIVHLSIREHNYSDTKSKLMLQDKLVLLNERLRNTQKYSKNMNEQIDNLIPDCEVIHIAFVCTCHTATRDVVILIKSILFNRKHQLHFHFISNRFARHILRNMFNTWELPSVKVSFYSVEEFQNKTGLNYIMVDTDIFYKLNLPKILPKTIKKVIVFDTDVIVNMDIAELWTLFDNFKDNKAIGAVENQNSIYLETTKNDEKDLQVWSKGVNTAVLLYDLKTLRKIGFASNLKTIVQKFISRRFSFEDIFNFVLKNNIGILEFLPDRWNLQLNGNASVEFCKNNVVSELKIVSGYSNTKFSFDNGCLAVFKKLRNLFLEISGNLLKRELSICKTSLPYNNMYNSLLDKKDNCTDFRIQQTNSFRTHLYFLEYEYEPKPNDVTLVTQMSIGRLYMFMELCKRWDGPISVALHLTEIEAYEFLKFVEEPTLRMRKDIGYHIVYKEGTTGLYPYNYLRNVAFENVNTPFIFLCDVDFSPLYGMYGTLRLHIVQNMDEKHKKALVVPAFEQTEYKLKFPLNKKELLIQLKKKQIIPFQMDIFSNGHAPTNYTRWILAKKPYKVNYGREYEPYMVLPKNAPKYDTRFVGWGWDKLSHTVELAADGYEFVVLPDIFIVHHTHAKTYHRTMYFADKSYIGCITRLREEFLNHVAVKYGQRGEALKNFIG